MAPLADRGRRLVARVIDALLIGIPVSLVLGLFWGWDYGTGFAGFSKTAVFTLLYLVYEGAMLSHSGQTVGKRLMRVRVALLSDGGVPTGAPAWLRAAVYAVPPIVPCLGTIFWLVNVLSCTWDKPYRQCVHDKAAKTVVVAV